METRQIKIQEIRIKMYGQQILQSHNYNFSNNIEQFGDNELLQNSVKWQTKRWHVNRFLYEKYTVAFQ